MPAGVNQDSFLTHPDNEKQRDSCDRGPHAGPKTHQTPTPRAGQQPPVNLPKARCIAVTGGSESCPTSVRLLPGVLPVGPSCDRDQTEPAVSQATDVV